MLEGNEYDDTMTKTHTAHGHSPMHSLVTLEKDLEDIISNIEEIGEVPLKETLEIVDATPQERPKKVGEFLEISIAQAIALCRYYNQPIIIDSVKPENYWNYAINIVTEFNSLRDKIGHIPTQKEMNEHGVGRMTQAIRAKFGTFRSFVSHMGLAYEGPAEVSKWRDWDVYKTEIQKMIQEHPSLRGKLPGTTWMRSHGYGHLVDPTYRIHGGIKKVREKLNRQPAVIQVDSDSSLSGIKKGLEDLWLRHPSKKNSLPPENWMRDRGYSRLAHAITRAGGFVKVRETFGYEQPQKHFMKDYNTWDKFAIQIQKLYAQHPQLKGKFPTYTWLRSHGYHIVVTAIHKFYGTVSKVRSRLHETQTRFTKEDYANPDWVKKQLDDIISRHAQLKGNPPNMHWLVRHGFVGFAHGIYNYFPNGYAGVNALYKFVPEERKPNGFWQVRGNIEKEFTAYVASKGYLPTSGELRRDNSSLHAAVGKNGGFARFVAMLPSKDVSDPLIKILEEYAR
ncbi:MAG TPA: hypothetical protein VK158_00685 [Acidobacteriota bacterium]|nr:hypothetical protein [Acidobacteriota bacterium]